jgi:hypothetical protein
LALQEQTQSVKTYHRIVSAFAILSACLAHGQGSFIYDQQSSATDSYTENSYSPINQVQPMGQSFTPTLPNVGFVRLFLVNGVPVEPAPITFTLNIRANSINGQILGSSQVTLDPAFAGTVDFLFNTPIAVTPGTTYYFQPVIQSDLWSAGVLGNTYPGGTIYSQGTAFPGTDLFFREGVLVPEPSALGLIVTGGALALVRRKRKRAQA